MTNSTIYKVYGNKEMSYPTFTEWREAVAWGTEHHKNFRIVELSLQEDFIEVIYADTHFNVYIDKADNRDNLVYHDGELLGRFPAKARRETILCAVEFSHELFLKEEARYDEEDAVYAQTNEGPYGGAFIDEFDFARHVGIDMKY